ncbi:MAG: DUF3332 domain-containing protein [Bacteroidales bacterium]|nr:MAG: DUF3332 domain-containing protein [Bacteroidales bacterium]
MKKINAFVLIPIILAIGSTQLSCIGSFKLTGKVYQWNQSTGNKFVRQLVFLALVAVPVYEISLVLDGLLLNTLEFWSGKNPIAMKAGEYQTKIVEQSGVKYRVTASQNRFDFIQLQGPQKGVSGALVYNPNKYSWSYEGNNQSIKLVELTKDGKANVFLPNERVIRVESNQNGISSLKAAISSQRLMAER